MDGPLSKCLRPKIGTCIYRRAIVGIVAQFMLWYGLFNIITGRTLPEKERWFKSSLNIDLGYAIIGAVVSIISGSLIPMSGLTGSWYRPKTIQKTGLILWIFGLSSAVFLWAGLFNLIQAGFYIDNYCSNFPHLGDCDDSKDGTLDSILCGPYYCTANNFGPECEDQACRSPMNNYNYLGYEGTDNKWLQDLIYAFIGFIGGGLCTGIWSLSCIYPHWHGVWWAEVIVPRDSIGNYIGWHSRALLSTFFQCMMWVGIYNLLQYEELYKNDAGKADESMMIIRDIVCIFVCCFILYLTGGLVGAAWLDDEPLQSAWYNLFEDISAWRGKEPVVPFGEPFFSISGANASIGGPKVTAVGQMPDAGPIETMFWYLRATMAAYAQTLWLCATWDLLDRIYTDCRYDFYNPDPSTYGCTGDSWGRNAVIFIIAVLLLWWARCLSWNGGVDPTWQLGMQLLNWNFLSGYPTGVDGNGKYRSRWTISKEVKIGGQFGSFLEPAAALQRKHYSDEYGLLDPGLNEGSGAEKIYDKGENDKSLAPPGFNDAGLRRDIL